VFYSLAKAAKEGGFYDSLTLQDACHPLTLLADEVKHAPLGKLHGTRLRRRVENQPGFKMVKWIRAIEFVASVRCIGEGEGGYNEDHEYFGELANIGGFSADRRLKGWVEGLSLRKPSNGKMSARPRAGPRIK
jgi:DMSO/TMAO reductase YedYZ molybdopterin-dependent catalytic subunit